MWHNRRFWRGGLMVFVLVVVASMAWSAGEGGEVATAEVVLVRLKELEVRLGEVRTVQTDFIQEKQLALFDRTLVLEGRIAIERGHRLAWHVAKPVRHSMVLQGERMQLWDEDANQVQTIKLDSNPAFKAMFEQLRAWFSGEYSLLAANYVVSLRSEEPLTFAFVPKAGTAMAKAIVEVTVSIAADRRRLTEIEMVEEGGDRNRIRFLNTVLDEPIPAAMWQVPPPPVTIIHQDG